MLSLKERDDAPPEVKKVVEAVRKHVLSEYGEGPDHKAVRHRAARAVAPCTCLTEWSHSTCSSRPTDKLRTCLLDGNSRLCATRRQVVETIVKAAHDAMDRKPIEKVCAARPGSARRPGAVL